MKWLHRNLSEWKSWKVMSERRQSACFGGFLLIGSVAWVNKLAKRCRDDGKRVGWWRISHGRAHLLYLDSQWIQLGSKNRKTSASALRHDHAAVHFISENRCLKLGQWELARLWCMVFPSLLFFSRRLFSWRALSRTADISWNRGEHVIGGCSAESIDRPSRKGWWRRNRMKKKENTDGCCMTGAQLSP